MIWFIFAILAAIFDATMYAFQKKLVKKIHYYTLCSGTYLICGIILFIIIIITGFPQIKNDFYYAFLITTIINIAILPLYYKALKITDLSLAIPMLSFTPAFLILTSYIFLKERVSQLGIIGILFIVIGSYVLHIKKKDKKLLDPIKSIFKNKGTFYILIMAFLVSISINFDKIMIQNSNPIFGASILFLFLGIITLTASFIKNKNTVQIYKNNFSKFLILGFVIVLATISVNLALSLGMASYVISIKRLSVLFSVFLGALMFKEKRIFKKSIGAFIMIIGAILIFIS